MASRRQLAGLVLSLSALVPFAASADPISQGLGYLAGTQGPSGAFGENHGVYPAESPIAVTDEALAAFRSANEAASPAVLGGELYLAVLAEPADTDLAIRRARALAPTAWVFAAPERTAHAEGFEATDAFHLALSMGALRPQLAPPTTADVARASALAALALAGGCYAYADETPSPEVTALAIGALRPFDYLTQVRAAEDSAEACLLAAQQGGGGFGSAADTATALLALSTSRLDRSAAVASARASLIATQAVDGSWDSSARATALAVRALASSGPDWRISTDTFGRPILYVPDPEPLQGQALAVTLDLDNRSPNAAPATAIRFKAMGLTLSDVPLAAMAGYEHRTVNAFVPTAGLRGSALLTATIDPDGLIPEQDELNNTASAPITVRAMNDLAVSPGGIRFTQGSGGHVDIAVTVQNLGVTLPVAVDVHVYRGAEGSAGVLLGGGTVSAGLLQNATSTIHVDWNASAANGPTAIHAVVDEANVLPEYSEDNNRAFRYYFPGSALAADLSVSAVDLTVKPSQPVPDQPFFLSATIHNLSPADANRVPVVMYDGTGQLLGAVELPLVPANGTATANLQAAIPGGQTLKVTVDPDLTLSDPNRNNNSAFISVQSGTSPAELSITNLGASPSVALADGDPFRIALTVNNSGNQPAQVVVRATQPSAGNAALAEITTSLGANDARGVTLGPVTMRGSAMALRVCVDADGAYAERNENDNCQDLSLSKQFGDLFVTPNDIAVGPVGADVGEKVTLRATVRSAGLVPATGVVEWWQGSPTAPEGRLIGATSVAVPAGGSATTTPVDWVRGDGPPEVFAQVTQVLPRDLQPSGNVAGRHLFLEQVVDLGAPGRSLAGKDIRVGKVTGGTDPDLVVSYENAQPGPNGSSVHLGGVALMQRQAWGSYSRLWLHEVKSPDGTQPGWVRDLALADLDGDAVPEVVVAWHYGTGSSTHNVVEALEPDGSTKWANDFLRSGASGCGGGQPTLSRIALGDVNGDGVADVLFLDTRLKVFSGSNGATLLDVLLAPVESACGDAVDAVVLDIDGDGANEILALTQGKYHLLDHSGSELRSFSSSNDSVIGAVVDINLDGVPDLLQPQFRGTIQARRLDTGASFQTSSAYESWEVVPGAVGSTRQDGLPSFSQGNDGFQNGTGLFRADLALSWFEHIGSGYSDFPMNTAMADLLNLGRPQIVALNAARAPVLYDGRDGRLMLPPAQIQPGTNGAGSQYAEFRSPLVAGLTSDRSSVLANIASNAPVVASSETNVRYGPGEVAIFSSAHWRHLPPSWPTYAMQHSRIDSNLHVSSDYRWWTHDNTWQNQWDGQDARLLADLTVSLVSVGPPSPAEGTAASVSVTVKNVGGVSAPPVQVDLYDGDPAAGGVRVGSGTTFGGPAPRGGTRTAALSWTAYPEGEHLLYAVANPSGAIEESGTENNTGKLRVFVQPATAACDLVIDPPSFSAAPASPGAGAAFTLSVTVRNGGSLACPETDLWANDAEDGTILAMGYVGALSPAQSETVSVSLQAVPGSRLYMLVADGRRATLDGDRSNNAASFELYVPPSPLPDLAVVSLDAGPSPAYPDEPLTATVGIRNLGAGSPATVVRVNLPPAPPRDLVVPPLLPGETVTLTAALAGPSSPVELTAVVDPEDAIAEYDESNNGRSRMLQPLDAAVGLAVVATPSSAGADANITLTFEIAELSGAARTVQLTGTVSAPAGEVVATLAPASVVLGAGQQLPVARAWSTGRNPPGAYRVDGAVVVDGRTAARASAAVTVLAVRAASLAMGTDRATYHPGEQALTSYRVSNDSPNTTLSGAALFSQVADSAGAVLFSSARPLPDIPAGQFFDASDLFRVSPTLLPGDYQVAAELRDSTGGLLATGLRPFTVEYTAQEQVRGALAVAGTFPVGPALSTTVDLTNPTAVPVIGAELRVLLKNAATLAVEGSAAVIVSLGAGQSSSQGVTVPTAGMPTGTKLVEAQLDGRTLDRRLSEAIATVDTEPPLIAVGGVTDGQVTSGDVTPLITIEDQSSFSSATTLDGVPYASGTPVTGEADHVLLVTAWDAYGNQSSLAVRFAIDRTAPELFLAGPLEGDVLAAATTLSWTSSDTHPGTTGGSLALNGGGEISIPSPTQVTQEGTYTWRVTSTDLAANTSSQTRHFSLDLTPPAISVQGVTHGELRNTAAVPVIQVTDLHLDGYGVTLDGAPFTSGTTVSAEGDHVLHVAALDAAGNAAAVDVQWAQDFTAPAISVTGIHDGDVSSVPVTITFRADDAHPGTASATLNGSSFTSGGTVSADGSYTLVVHSTDAAGNQAAPVTIAFAIESTAPGVSITGVADGECRAGPVTPVVTEVDPFPGPLTITLNGQPFTSGTAITAGGQYTLHAHAVNQGNVSADRQLSFIIDLTAPGISVSGVQDGEYRKAPVTVNAAATDSSPGATLQLTLDGAAFASGGTVSTEGAHALHAAATDCAGNQASRDVAFTLDFTAPVITITGVSEGQTGESFTIAFSATDANLDAVAATLDGAAFEPGTAVAAEGAHTLVVTATDLAGNAAAQAVHFTVIQMSPTFHYSVCANGTLTVRDRAAIGSSTAAASVACHGAFNLLNNAVIWGDAVSGGNATTRNTSVLHGRMYHGGTFSSLDGSVVTGGNQLVAPPPAPCECGYNVPAKLALAAASNDNALLAADPTIAPHLIAGGLSVGGRTTITLPGGRFYLSYVRLADGSRVTVAPGTSVQLFVAGKVEVLNFSTLGAPASTAPALLLVSGADAALNQPVSILNTADAALRVYAPKADVALANTTHLAGAVVGRNLTIRDDDVLSLMPGPQEIPPALTCP